MEKIREIERKIKESQEKGKKLKQAYLNEIPKFDSYTFLKM